MLIIQVFGLAIGPGFTRADLLKLCIKYGSQFPTGIFKPLNLLIMRKSDLKILIFQIVDLPVILIFGKQRIKRT